MTTISEALLEGRQLLGASVTLDAELLLCHALGQNRTYLRTWPENILDGSALARYRNDIVQRQSGVPIAHLLGHQAFWTLDLEVSPLTLIPRQDTELLVELALAIDLPSDARVLDLGTGTGAVALSLASERVNWRVTASDYSSEIVALAERNAQRNTIFNTQFICSDWYASLPDEHYHLIVSNPPYIAPNDPHLSKGDLRYESQTALVAADEGLSDIKHIVEQGCRYLKPAAWLMLEHGYDQARQVRACLTSKGYINVASHQDLGGNDRVTLGQWSGDEFLEDVVSFESGRGKV